MALRTNYSEPLNNFKDRLRPNIHFHKPDFKFKRHLDPPWDNGLGKAVKIVSALILFNTTLILLLGIIAAATTDLSADKRKKDQDYIESHTMLIYAQLIYFYLTIPLVYVATNVTENWVLWEDKLRPLYVICAAVIAINVWILQLTLWTPCMFASSKDSGGLRGPGYCPYVFHGLDVDIATIETTGSPKMLIFAVPSLFLLYIAYLALGIIAFRRERHKPQKTDPFDISGPYSGASRSDPESLPFRMFWPSGNSPPKSTKSSPDQESMLSPMTRKQEKGPESEEDCETTPSLRAEPAAISLMLTTPHGTTERTEEQNPFDDDRLSRLGHRVH